MEERIPLIRKMVEERLTYEEIGKVFNISKQRVHQLFKNYTTAPYHKKGLKHEWTFLLGRPCEVCDDKEKIAIHHRDGDRNNNNPDNLQSLCKEHHSEAEKLLIQNGVKKWNYSNREIKRKGKKCFVCQKKIWVIPSKEKRANYCSNKCASIGLIKPLKHGTFGGYSNKGCRCDLCRKANTFRCKIWREENRKKSVDK